MRILQASSQDIGGGAERIAWLLFEGYRQRGHTSHLAVGRKRSDDPDVFLVPNEDARRKSSWTNFWLNQQQRFDQYNFKGAWRLSRVAYNIAEPQRSIERHLGHEDFHFPASRHIIELPPQKPDIFHAHNLHNGYFDLRYLPQIDIPVVLTLHDAWLLSGHCAHSFGCERWQIGCGQCPDLTIYPAVRRDATAYNWRRKHSIYQQSRLYISAPSQWLLDKVKASMLAPAALETRVIPYGVDLRIFQPSSVKPQLDFPQDRPLVLFMGNRQNIFKDYALMRRAIELYAQQGQQPVLFVALGAESDDEHLSEQVSIRYVPYQKDLLALAQYYQAADIFLHAAKQDTFPNTVLEALACGTPVIGSAVGGIPEQIQTDGDQPTGILINTAEEMYTAIKKLLEDATLRQQMGRNAAKVAQQKYDLQDYIQAHLDWYSEILQ